MTSHRTAAALAGVYGAVALIGGIIGFVKAGSAASLIAGGIAGLVLIGSAIAARRKPKPALITAAVVSIVLIGRFAKGLFAAGGPTPLALIMVLGGVAVLVSSVLALLSRSPAASQPAA